MKFAVVSVLVSLLLAACAGNNNPTNEVPNESGSGTTAGTTADDTTGSTANSESNAKPVLLTYQPIDIAGVPRSYHLYVPERPASAKMVMLLHGNRGSSDQILGLERTVAPFKLWMDIALRENLILIVPDGEVGNEGHQGWNDCRSDAPTNPLTDDVLFISKLIDEVSNRYNTPESKVYSAGVSNGGMMTMRLADEIPEKLHAIAIIVASRPINTECPDAITPLSTLIMNGVDDPILPYEGGHIRPQRGELFSTLDSVAYWVNRNQTNTLNPVVDLPDLEPNENSVVRVFSYQDGINGTQVKHYEVIGGGHTEPSIKEQYSNLWKSIVGEQNNDIEMAEEVWGFFESL